MYQITVCSIKQLYQYAQEGDMSDVALLAVSSYEINTDKLTTFGNALCLCFADVTASDHLYAFTKDMANRIAAYVRAQSARLDTLFVCCDSGESRSAAMAAAILRYNGMDEGKIWKNPHYHPNPLVYSLLCGALGVPVAPAELQAKCRTSQTALTNAIRQS